MIRVPSFLTKVDKEEKQDLMKEYVLWKKQHCTEYLVKKLEDELDKLIIDEEKNNFSSYFETRWARAKRLGSRATLRHILKDLK
jgi:hypothetical protein